MFDHFRPKHYLSSVLNTGNDGVFQIDSQLLDRRLERKMDESILRLAQEEYDIQHPGQPYERIQQRGGLSILEIIALLSDHIDRLKYQLGHKG